MNWAKLKLDFAPCVCLLLTTFLLLDIRKAVTQTALYRVSLEELVPLPEINQWCDLHIHVFWWKDSLIFYSCLLLLPRLASAEVCFPFGAKSQQVLQAGCQTGSYSGRVKQISKQCVCQNWRKALLPWWESHQSAAFPSRFLLLSGRFLAGWADALAAADQDADIFWAAGLFATRASVMLFD